MYLSGNLAVDPSQLSKIELHAPEGFFKKILFTLTKSGGKKIQKQTFKAWAILQEIQGVFKAAGINNIVRLSQDETDYYFDQKGIDNDFELALETYDSQTIEAEADLFNVLHLILEHSKGSFKYLIDIRINRTHAVGKYPIDINVSGLLKEFQASDDDTEAVKAKMQEIFSSQESYDQFIKTKQLEFDQFLQELEHKIRSYIRIDDVKVESKQKMLVPKEKAPQHTRDIAPQPTAPQPMLNGYHGFGNMIWYAMIWSSMCHSNHIHVQNVELHTDSGDVIGEVGDAGIDTGETDLFNEDVPLDDRLSDSANTEGIDGMDDMGDGMDGVDMGGDDSWFDGDGFDFGGDFDFGGFDF